MNKKDFLRELQRKLKALKKEERKKYIEYYDEIISDIVENGVSEEEAIRHQGSIAQIANDILANTSPANMKIRDWRSVALLTSSAILFLCSLLSVILMREFQVNMSASTGIIGGADGPTAILIAGKIGPPWGLYFGTAVVVVATVVYFVRRRKK